MKHLAFRVSDEVAAAFAHGSASQHLSGVEYVSGLILRDAGRVSGLGVPVWRSAALDARIGNAVMNAIAAAELGDAPRALIELRDAQRLIAQAIGENREAIDTATQQRMRLRRAFDDKWGDAEHELGTANTPPRPALKAQKDSHASLQERR